MDNEVNFNTIKTGRTWCASQHARHTRSHVSKRDRYVLHLKKECPLQEHSHDPRQLPQYHRYFQKSSFPCARFVVACARHRSQCQQHSSRCRSLTPRFPVRSGREDVSVMPFVVRERERALRARRKSGRHNVHGRHVSEAWRRAKGSGWIKKEEILYSLRVYVFHRSRLC